MPHFAQELDLMANSASSANSRGGRCVLRGEGGYRLLVAKGMQEVDMYQAVGT